MMRIDWLLWFAFVLAILPLGPRSFAREDREVGPRFEFRRQTDLVDEPLTIQLVNLKPGQRVTVHAVLDEFASQTEAVADEKGRIDLSGPSPDEAGPKTGAPLRILWSMRPNPAAKPDGDKGVVRLRAEVDGKVIANANLEQRFVAATVVRTEIKEQGLRCVLYLPAREGRFPGVILFTGSGGGLDQRLQDRAGLLASRGYAALALAYFNHDDLPKHLIEIPLEYFETALKWMQAHPQVRSDKLAVMGGSRGGELALLLGTTFPQVKAVVAYVPSHVVWGGFPQAAEDIKQRGRRPAWTYRGKPVPFYSKGGFADSLTDDEEARRVAIPVEKINGPVLLISGKDDRLWPSAPMADLVMKRLTEHKRAYPDRHLSYDGCGHAIDAPARPVRVGPMKHPVSGYELNLGGSLEGTAYAAWDSWPKVVKFLGESLK